MCLPLREAVPRAASIFFFMKYSTEWLEKNNKYTDYKHFDKKVLLKNVIKDIEKPQNIEKHAFIPFLRIYKRNIKYNGKDKKVKVRSINYASHYDSCIYKYYSFLVDKAYEKYAKTKLINKVAIGYRSSFQETNIQFAKQAFDFIKKQYNSIVFIGDFTDFFDNLDHKYLKKQLCKIFGVASLPLDQYQVFKSLTKYTFVEKHALNTQMKANGEVEYKHILLPIQKLNDYKHLIHKKATKGVAQGISLSAIYSNVYMIDFDEICNKLAHKYNGLYLRYSDDFIFVFPDKEPFEVKMLYKEILRNVAYIPGLSLSTEKTKIYYCSKDKIKSCEKEIGASSNSKNSIDYLGFNYDGKWVRIREKTIAKYYYRTYSKIKFINFNRRLNRQPQGKKNLYLTYSLKGTKIKKNFLTYVNRCIDEFGYGERVHSVLNKHYGKIKKRLIKMKEGN